MLPQLCTFGVSIGNTCKNRMYVFDNVWYIPYVGRAYLLLRWWWGKYYHPEYLTSKYISKGSMDGSCILPNMCPRMPICGANAQWNRCSQTQANCYRNCDN